MTSQALVRSVVGTAQTERPLAAVCPKSDQVF
jgi:hypothetical protein